MLKTPTHPKQLNQNPPSAACSPASAASTSASSRRALPPRGRSKSTTCAAPSLPTDSRMPPNLPTYAPSCPSYGAPTSSSADSLVKTFQQWASAQVWQASAPGCSSTPSASSNNSDRDFWCWKMSTACSHQTMAETSKRCLKRLPNAGMWDTGACLTLVISESPKTAAAYSSLQALESSPHWSLWLMPDQWAMFLARAKRARKTASIHSLPDSQAGQASIFRVPASSLSPEHGIRWLSGSERLRISGFAGDWLRPTLQRLGLPETPSCRKSHGGLPTS